MFIHLLKSKITILNNIQKLFTVNIHSSVGNVMLAVIALFTEWFYTVSLALLSFSGNPPFSMDAFPVDKQVAPTL